ncbi:MAG: hypothetical protein ACYCZO_15070 [Daejeonella sp.]
MKKIRSTAFACIVFFTQTTAQQVIDIAKKPNIIWIITEDMSLEMGC